MTSVSHCPDWHEDIDSRKESEFEDRIADCISRIEDFLRFRSPLDSDLQALHFCLFNEFVPLPCYAGNYRQRSIEPSKRCLEYEVAVGAISGAHSSKVEARMQELLSECGGWFRTANQASGPESAILFAVSLSYVLGEFIRIHPFVNGNGRLSRLIWYWCCRRMMVSPMVQIHPRPPGPQYSSLMASCMAGDDNPLAIAILRALESLGETPDP